MPKKVLTGIKPTGRVHLGNYIGAIKPSIKLSQQENTSTYLFIADSHSLTSQSPAKDVKHSIYEVGSALMACGLNPDKVLFYCQSDIPELFELNWILSCITPKGMMNRVHSYKAKKDENLKLGKKDLDDKVYMGLYNYPILMTADILIFSADQIPVGKDQAQHLEMARDIANKFNHIYKTDLLHPPQALFQETNILPGLDGRKMSKSYKNEIPLFLDSKKLQNLVKKIKTDSSPPEEPKDPKACLIFQIYKHFAHSQELAQVEERYLKGIGWGEAKDILFHKLEDYFKDKKEIYDFYMSKPEELEKILKQGAEKVREESHHFLKQVKKTVGLLKEL